MLLLDELLLLQRTEQDTIKRHTDVQRIGFVVHDIGGDDRYRTSREIDLNRESLLRLNQNRRFDDERTRPARTLGDQRSISLNDLLIVRSNRDGGVATTVDFRLTRERRQEEERLRDLQERTATDAEIEITSLKETIQVIRSDVVDVQRGVTTSDRTIQLGIRNPNTRVNGFDQEVGLTKAVRLGHVGLELGHIVLTESIGEERDRVLTSSGILHIGVELLTNALPLTIVNGTKAIL